MYTGLGRLLTVMITVSSYTYISFVSNSNCLDNTVNDLQIQTAVFELN